MQSWVENRPVTLNFPEDIACTQTFISLRSFRKDRRASERARASERERERRWRSINPPRISFLSRALDGIWRENRGSVNRLLSTLTLQAVATYISHACLQRKKRWTNSAVWYFCRVIFNINFFCIFHLQSWFRLYYFLLWTRIKTTRSLVLYKKRI